MKNLQKLFNKVIKLPDISKEVITFDKKGQRNVNFVTMKDRYLVTFDNGNSIAITSKDFDQYGINASDIQKSYVKEPEKSVEIEKVSKDSDKNEEEVA